MQLIEETEVTIELADLFKRSPVIRKADKKGKIVLGARSKGKHVMAILRYCAIEARILKPGEPLEEDLPLWMALGMAWEEFAASFYPDMVWQPGEFEESGIYGNPDGMSTLELPSNPIARRVAKKMLGIETYPGLEEFKFTRKKAKHGDEILSEWLWMQQLRAYCGYLQCQYARLHVCYINGDYKPLESKYIRYLIKFEEVEVFSTWRMLIKNKKHAERE